MASVADESSVRVELTDADIDGTADDVATKDYDVETLTSRS